MDKAKLIARLQTGNMLLERAMAELGDAKGIQTGTMEQWSVKDTLAHLTAWQKNLADWLDLYSKGKVVANAPAFTGKQWDDVNAFIFAENQHCPWEEVLERSRHVFWWMIELVQVFSDEELDNPQRFEWLGGQPLWKRIIGDFYWHVQGHLVQLYTERLDVERGLEIAEAYTNQVGPDEPEADRGAAFYNLACFYALAGRPGQAIPILRAALVLNPDLVEWSKQDNDLNPLRDDPAFQALYQVPLAD